MMKSGLYYSNESQSDPYLKLKSIFDLDFVSSVASLKSSLHRKEYDFVYIDLDDTASMLELIHVVFKLDDELVLMTHRDYKFPRIDHFYVLPHESVVSSVIEILSFDAAKKTNSLQAIYGEFDERGHDHFFLSEHSPLGIILTDAEDSIFYVNDTAKTLINFDEEHRLMKFYLNLDKTSLDDEPWKSAAQTRLHDFVPVLDSDLYVNVLQKDVIVAKEKMGSITYVEDVTDQHEASLQLTQEKSKYQKLTNRLNDIILKGLGADIYNQAYIKRKIDLEIRHAKKVQGESQMVYIGISQFDILTRTSSDRKSILIEATKMISDKFSDLHIVGDLQEGHWIVILQSGVVDVETEVQNFCQQLETKLNAEFGKVFLAVKHRIFDGLDEFESSESFLKALDM